MMFGSRHRQLRALVPLAISVLTLLPAGAEAQTAAQIALSQATSPPSQTAQAAGPAATVGTNAATTDQVNPPQQKTLTAKAIERVKEVAKSASNIFGRVPCLPPKRGLASLGSLPHVANRLIAGQPVMIVAFGSSSTQGFGSSAPEFTYPNRLAALLKRHYPIADITVINAGVGGEDAPEMMKRLQSTVIDRKPDLVIWQVGTNAVLRELDPVETGKLVEDGIARIQAAGSDVVLVDPQYAPRVNERGERLSRMVKLLGNVATLRHVGIFPRFEVMRDWHEQQALPVENFVTADGLHMNDWGYACFAQLLADDIIQSVGQIKLGVVVPADVRAYRPM
jgi:lysophospholipase L1-like esterase